MRTGKANVSMTQVFKSLLSTWYLVTQAAAVMNGAVRKRTSAVNLAVNNKTFRNNNSFKTCKYNVNY